MFMFVADAVSATSFATNTALRVKNWVISWVFLVQITFLVEFSAHCTVIVRGGCS